ncbi:Phage major capsid protein, HK97 family OS=Rhodothermus marinus (strain ATCC 43812 / DSM 4252 / R-10) GN=Rmar_1022 PE=4 SV=1: Phage_capsid [Gemmataceae bacterium]|nr:Phage major capsid protein, HK97 family OS=Rhodothermus marinus (strain ATCC 43812 / DSM 4252 / R-10) GN=Rmar_1022 PE=4 SV=1: Phage_capsid [Gemmataceae bacterium]VTU02427.1 Phage major capsid protein, HK97 family OS=Rhodothermus marinus (strain ATCC 43812 / DSM 4252 / R-10) GN=Rmar_1022 PE=4 SV=1: Phage_capsid [Gemmataceae bacterium]
MNPQDLREQRAKLIANAKVIVDAAEADQRDLTPDENTQIEAIFTQADQLDAQAASAETKSKVLAADAHQRESTGRKTAPGKLASVSVSENDRKAAFRAWAMYGTGQVGNDMLGRASLLGLNVASRSLNLRELRALSKSTSNAPVPADFTSEYEKKLAYFFPIGGAVTSFTTADGRDLPFTVVDDTGNSAAIVSEAGSIGSSSDPSFTKVTFKAWKYASPIVKVSVELLQDSVIDLESYLAEAFGERFGRAYEAAVVSTNAGSAAPEGMLYGVSAGVNLASGNALTLAKLIDLETSVDIAYRNLPGAGFVMHDATWAAIRQLADDQNFPIFMGNLQEGTTPRLLGYPVYISNQMTSIASPGDNAPLILFGALSKYRWRTCSDRVLTRLDELYAATGEVGFVMLERADGRYLNKSGVKTLNSYDAP